MLFENLYKNVKLAVCRFLSYGDILALGQTCKANYQCILDNEFWAFLLTNKFDVKLDMINDHQWRYKFLEMTMKNKVETYLHSSYKYENLDKHIKKFDNVLTVMFSDYANGYYYFLIQWNDENRLLANQMTDYETVFLYDRRYHVLVLFNTRDGFVTVIDTQKAEIIRESIIAPNMSIFDFPDLSDEHQKWVQQNNFWSCKCDKYKITLDMMGVSLVVESVD